MIEYEIILKVKTEEELTVVKVAGEFLRSGRHMRIISDKVISTLVLNRGEIEITEITKKEV